eukprot:scaffold11277_cov107-Isochrysis_galbana.AAC.1
MPPPAPEQAQARHAAPPSPQQPRPASSYVRHVAAVITPSPLVEIGDPDMTRGPMAEGRTATAGFP